MSPLIPYIDSSQLASDGICYYFIDDNIVVTFDDETSKVYKLINDKIYLSNDVVTINNSDNSSTDETSSSLESSSSTCDNLFDLSSIDSSVSRGITASYDSSSDSLSFSGTFNYNSSRYYTNVYCDTSETLYIKLNNPVPLGFQYRFTVFESSNGGTVTISEATDSNTISCSAGDRIYFWIQPNNGVNGNGTIISMSDVKISITKNAYSNYCKFGSSDTPIPGPDPTPVVTDCYTYNDIVHIPHSMSGLSPLYCFLCVVIFCILIYFPYKILIRPFFQKL